MQGHRIGYVRVSSFDQNPERQLEHVRLRGRENIQKRYLLHVAGFNLGLLMRVKTGHGTPRGWASAWLALIWPNQHPSMAYLAVVMVVEGRCCGIMPIAIICGGE